MSLRVYNASAGSGKTYLLVKEYLKIIVSANPSQAFKSVLAITFTNKAANEMKMRIIDALANITETKYKNLLNTLVDETGLSAEEITKNASTALINILHNYADFHVSTIDSFTHKVIRAFSKDLKLKGGFDVSMENDEILSKAVANLIDKAGTNDFITKLLTEFTLSKFNDEKSWELEKSILGFYKELDREQFENAKKNLIQLDKDNFNRYKLNLFTYKNWIESTLQEIGVEGLKIAQDYGILPDFTNHKSNGILKYFEYLANKDSNKFIPTPSNIDGFEKDKFIKPTYPEFAAQKEQFNRLFKKALDFISTKHQTYFVVCQLVNTIYEIGLFSSLTHEINEIKDQEGIILISEFNSIVSEVVRNEPAPFIYARIGEKYKHYFIDEFQDTSVLQWQNLLPLVENSLATNSKTLLVGDVKQAIYRFRGGNPEQLAEFPKLNTTDKNPNLLSYQNTIERNFTGFDILNTNYRSTHNIVQFNNQFFQLVYNQLNDDQKKLFKDFIQQPKNTVNEGFVKIELLNEDNDEELYNIQCQKILETIIDLKNRNYKLSDIAILTRVNYQGAKIAGYLIQHEIDVVSSEALLLKNSPFIGIIHSLLKILNTPNEQVHRARFHFWVKKSGVTHLNNLANLLLSGKMLNEISEIEELTQQQNTNAYNLYEKIEHIIRVLQLQKLNEPFIPAFLNVAFNYMQTNSQNISGFIEWFEKESNKPAIEMPETPNAVKIMTIHKSKGLEFPVVILPFTWFKIKKQFSKAVIEINQEEIDLKTGILSLNKNLESTPYNQIYTRENNQSNLDIWNLYYVAFTRPINELYVFSRVEEKPRTDNFSYGLLKIFDQLNINAQNKIKTFGNPLHLTEVSKESEEFKEKGYLISNSWQQKIKIGSKYLPANASPYSTVLGTKVHQVLKSIYHISDVEHAVNKRLALGDFDEETAQNIITQIKVLLQNPALKPYFENNISGKNERQILLPNGTIQIPDRVVFLPNQTVVIDYKTGQTLSSHKTQILNYVKLLTQMGFKNVQAFIAYLPTGQVVKAA